MTTTRRSATRETFLANILTTAVEGGIGYWSQVVEYAWYDPTMQGGTAQPGPAGGGNAYAVLYVPEGPDGTEKVYNLTPEVIAHGLRVIERDSRVIRSRIRGVIVACSRASDTAPDGLCGDIDADAADAIVQAGLFGEVIFG